MDFPKIWGSDNGLIAEAKGKLRTMAGVDAPFLHASAQGFKVRKTLDTQSIELSSPSRERMPVFYALRTMNHVYEIDLPGDPSAPAMKPRVMFAGVQQDARDVRYLPGLKPRYATGFSTPVGWREQPGAYMGRGQFWDVAYRRATGLGARAISYEGDYFDDRYMLMLYQPADPPVLNIMTMNGLASAGGAPASIPLPGLSMLVDVQSCTVHHPTFLGFTPTGDRVFLWMGADLAPPSWNMGTGVGAAARIEGQVVAPKAWRIVVATNGTYTVTSQTLPTFSGAWNHAQQYSWLDNGNVPVSGTRENAMLHFAGRASTLQAGCALIPVAGMPLRDSVVAPVNATQVVITPSGFAADAYRAGYYLTEDYGLTFRLVESETLGDFIYGAVAKSSYFNSYGYQMHEYLRASGEIFASRASAEQLSQGRVVLFAVASTMDSVLAPVPGGTPTQTSSRFCFFTADAAGDGFTEGGQHWLCNTYGTTLELLQPNTPTENGFLLPVGAKITVLSETEAIASVYDGQHQPGFQANYNVLFFRTVDSGLTWSRMSMAGVGPAPAGSMSSLTGTPSVLVQKKHGRPGLLGMMCALDSQPSVQPGVERKYSKVGLFLSKDDGQNWRRVRTFDVGQLGRDCFPRQGAWECHYGRTPAYLPVTYQPDEPITRRNIHPFAAGIVTRITTDGFAPAPAEMVRPWLFEPQ